MWILQRFVDWGRYWLNGLVNLLLPVFQPAQFMAMGRILWTILHICLVIGITIGLWYLNIYMGWYRAIPRHPYLARAWLSILFLLVYALAWLSWLLWKLIVADELEATYPDIEDAWNRGVA